MRIHPTKFSYPPAPVAAVYDHRPTLTKRRYNHIGGTTAVASDFCGAAASVLRYQSSVLSPWLRSSPLPISG
jgi:hypothetical protein